MPTALRPKLATMPGLGGGVLIRSTSLRTVEAESSCGSQYEPTVIDGESGLVLLLEVVGNGFDLVEFAVEVLVC